MDDDELIHTLIPDALERFFGTSFPITHARTPSEAIAKLESLHGPLVILSDFDLKAEVDGIELLTRIAALRPDTLRVLFSGHPREHVQPRLAGAPIHAFFEKPYRIRELVEPLAVILRPNSASPPPG